MPPETRWVAVYTHMKSNDKIVVTGGTGFLGSHILRGLIEKGYTNIFALKRAQSSTALVTDIEDQIQWVEGDILDIVSLEFLFKEAKYAIHSAAKVSYNPADRKSVHTVNVEGTANIVNAALGVADFGKLIFISSVAAIGRPMKKGQINEKTEWNENKETSNYALAKHQAELEVWRGMTEGMDVGILNPSMILGPSFWGDSSTKLFTYAAEENRFYPTGSNGFVDVRDVARLAIIFLESLIKNERMLAVSEMYSYEQLLKTIASAMKVKAPQKALSPLLSGFLWRLASLQKDPTITKETVSITSSHFDYDNRKSKEAFQFTYIPIEKSVEDTVACFLESKEKKSSYSYFSKIFD